MTSSDGRLSRYRFLVRLERCEGVVSSINLALNGEGEAVSMVLKLNFGGLESIELLEDMSESERLRLRTILKDRENWY